MTGECRLSMGLVEGPEPDLSPLSFPRISLLCLLVLAVLCYGGDVVIDAVQHARSKENAESNCIEA